MMTKFNPEYSIRKEDYMKERTYAMLKPDGVRKELFPEVVKRIEGAGLEVVQSKKMVLDEYLSA